MSYLLNYLPSSAQSGYIWVSLCTHSPTRNYSGPTAHSQEIALDILQVSTSPLQTQPSFHYPQLPVRALAEMVICHLVEHAWPCSWRSLRSNATSIYLLGPALPQFGHLPSCPSLLLAAPESCHNY